MYNQFIPPDGFRPVSPPSGTPPREDHPPKGRSPLSALLSSLLGKGGSGGGNATGKTGLAGLLDKFGLSQLDHGDFLLLFILIYLLAAGHWAERRPLASGRSDRSASRPAP